MLELAARGRIRSQRSLSGGDDRQATPARRRPKVYIAAAFRQFSNWKPGSFQAYGQIADEGYVELLEAIERIFIKFGFETCLPHRDEGRWGSIYYTPSALGALCFRHVETSDMVFALAEEGRGVHLELGFAAGIGEKPMILMYREGSEPSTLLWGLPGIASPWNVAGSRATTSILEYGDQEDLLRQLAQTLEARMPQAYQDELEVDARVSLIDIGSHTVKFQIQRRRAGRLVQVIAQEQRSLGLLSALLDNRIPETAIDQLLSLLREWKRRAEAERCSHSAIVGTAALRRIHNIEDVHSAVEGELGWQLEVLDHDTELGYVVNAINGTFDTSKPIGVLNVGGGSTQAAVLADGVPQSKLLLDFGTKELTTRWPWDGPMGDGDYEQLLRTVTKAIDQSSLSGEVSRLVHTGGELDFLLRCVVPMRTSNLSASHVSEISIDDFAEFSDQLRRFSRQEASQRFGLDPAWAAGSIASNVLALGTAKALKAEAIVPSNLNISDGIALKELASAVGRRS